MAARVIDRLILGVLLAHALLRLGGLGGDAGLGRLLRLMQLREVKERDVHRGGWHRSFAANHAIACV